MATVMMPSGTIAASGMTSYAWLATAEALLFTFDVDKRSHSRQYVRRHGTPESQARSNPTPEYHLSNHLPTTHTM